MEKKYGLTNLPFTFNSSSLRKYSVDAGLNSDSMLKQLESSFVFP